MDVLITYDVSTLEKEGRRRLRQIAKLCEDYGQRVQYSVFECSINAMQMDQFTSLASKIINSEEDSLRIYRLHGGRKGAVKVMGKDAYMDFTEPLIL